MPNTTIATLPYPDGANAASIALYFQQLAQALDTKVISVFATNAARDAAIPSPTTGMKCVAAGRELLYRAGAWAKQGGVRELAYELGNGPASGSINVGAGPTPVISVNVTATTIAADTAHVHCSLGIKSSGSTVGTVSLVAAGVTFNQTFNIGISTTPIPVVIEMPISIPAASFNVAVLINPTSGNACNLDYSAMRVTY